MFLCFFVRSICFHNKWFADCVYSSSTNIPSKATVQKIWWQSNGTYVGRKTLAEKHPFFFKERHKCLSVTLTLQSLSVSLPLCLLYLCFFFVLCFFLSLLSHYFFLSLYVFRQSPLSYLNRTWLYYIFIDLKKLRTKSSKRIWKHNEKKRVYFPWRC